ncbi:MAG: phasin family protein [Roseovarius sp.]
MAKAPKTDSTPKDEAPLNAIEQLQDAGLGNMVGLSTAWFEALGDLSSEVLSFVSDRVKEDVKVQHEVLHCKDVTELQHIQSQFLQKAVDQYQAETGKLVAMSTKAFAPPTDK